MVESFIVLSRSDCHLCDVLVDDLRRVTAGHIIKLTVVDVDSDPRLAARYGSRVPVLLADDEEVCHHRLDHERVAALLSDV